LGVAARRAAADLRVALSVVEGESLPIHVCSAQSGEGVEALFDAILSVFITTPKGKRSDQALHWLKAAIMADFGTEGLAAAARSLPLETVSHPFAIYEQCRNALTMSLSNLDFQPEFPQ